MKKLFWLAAVTFFLGACGSNNVKNEDASLGEADRSSTPAKVKKSKKDGGKSIVVYYSLTENTRAVAEEIQKQVEGASLRIETQEPYPEEYDEVLDIVQAQRERNELPAIVSKEITLADYDVIYLGAPIWFGEPALPVEQWLRENDLAGKRVYPFFTSGSSSINESMKHYSKLLDGSTLGKGLGINSSNKQHTAELVEEWLAQLD
ncbi:flavodoxin family protein [Enterococcus sp. AZ196]|uniref:flavodoxin family protein n=1 Tax=Enterococcus sp. AZ196 TaxID=2774659 RepID=UPI003D2A9760